MNVKLDDVLLTNKPLNPKYIVFAHIPVSVAKELHTTAQQLDSNVISVSVKGQSVNVTSMLTDRVQNLINNCNCVSCYRSIDYFSVERNSDHYHLNAYDSEGVMMTRDHIIPKSNGGKDHISNYQLMCYTCNQSKSNLSMEEFLLEKTLSDSIGQYDKLQRLSTTFYSLKFKNIKNFSAEFAALTGDKKLTQSSLLYLKLFHKGKELAYLKDNVIVPLNLVFNTIKDFTECKDFTNFIYLEDFMEHSSVVRPFIK